MAPAPEPAPAPPPVAAPVELPSAPIAVPPPAAAPASPPSVLVYHVRGGGRFLGIFGRKRGSDYGKDSCVGTMELLPDGMHFKTTRPCPDTKADEEKQFTFPNIKKFALEDERLRIEAEDKNWDFVGPPNALARVEQHIRAGKDKQ